MKIKGSCDQIRAQLKEKKNIQCRRRFEEAIDYFSRIAEMLKFFNHQSDNLLETNLNFKSVNERRRSRQMVNRQSFETQILVFDFGLILKQHTLFHAGLIFSVVVTR